MKKHVSYGNFYHFHLVACRIWRNLNLFRVKCNRSTNLLNQPWNNIVADGICPKQIGGWARINSYWCLSVVKTTVRKTLRSGESSSVSICYSLNKHEMWNVFAIGMRYSCARIETLASGVLQSKQRLIDESQSVAQERKKQYSKLIRMRSFKLPV